MTLGDSGGHVIPIIRTVAGERGERACHLIEQRIGLGAVIDLVAGQR